MDEHRGREPIAGMEEWRGGGTKGGIQAPVSPQLFDGLAHLCVSVHREEGGGRGHETILR